MLIAAAHDVRATYPDVPPAAVSTLLHALSAAAPLLQAGHIHAGCAELRRRLAVYPGDYGDLQQLGVPAIFTAAERGADALTAQLGELQLLADTTGPVYVLTGDALAARIWAYQRGITRGVVVAQGAADTARLRRIDPRRAVIVRLDRSPLPQALDDRLQTMLLHGATTRAATWRPDNTDDPDAGRPQLDFR